MKKVAKKALTNAKKWCIILNVNGKHAEKTKYIKERLDKMKNANFTCRLIKRGRGTDTYEVANTNGMTKDEIIDACDFNNFGGYVYGTTVEVYTD